MPSYRHILLMLLLATVGLRAPTMLAQEQLQRLPRARVTVDEDILSALTDEPCRHFEEARDDFIARRFSPAAAHLRTATAYLRLEAARADEPGRAALQASVQELLDVAAATEEGRIQTVETLKQVFARAHYALAAHHCIQTAHSCCQPATVLDPAATRQAGHDLRAASVHLERGLRWAGDEIDEATRRTLRNSEAVAGQLINRDAGAPSEAQRLLHVLSGKLESLTGHKIMIARPVTPDTDEAGPSIFR